MQATYDFHTAEARRDPYPRFAALREADPVHWNGDSWTLTRHADVLQAFTDPRFSSDRITPGEDVLTGELAQFAPVFEISRAMMLFRDPPVHTRLRGLVAQAFSAKMIE